MFAQHAENRDITDYSERLVTTSSVIISIIEITYRPFLGFVETL